MNTKPLSSGADDALLLSKARAPRCWSAERFVRSSLMKIVAKDPFGRRLVANIASRTLRVMNFTITGGVSVDMVDFLRRCTIEMFWVVI